MVCSVLPGAPGRGGKVAPCGLCSKNSSRKGAEGKMTGLLPELLGDASPPSSSWQACCEGSQSVRDGRPPRSLHPSSGRRRDPVRGAEGPARRAQLFSFLPPLQPQSRHRAWELLGPDVVGLPECRLAGQESDLGQLAFSHYAIPALAGSALLSSPGWRTGSSGPGPAH